MKETEKEKEKKKVQKEKEKEKHIDEETRRTSRRRVEKRDPDT